MKIVLTILLVAMLVSGITIASISDKMGYAWLGFIVAISSALCIYKLIKE